MVKHVNAIYKYAMILASLLNVYKNLDENLN